MAALDTLVRLALVPKQLCASPNDTTRNGIANETVAEFATHSNVYSDLVMQYPLTYVGFANTTKTQEWYSK